MAIYLQKGSKIYWYEFEFMGERYRESSKSSSKSLAAAAMRARRRHLEENYAGVKRRDVLKRFPAAAEEYLVVKQARIASSSLAIERYSVAALTPFFRNSLLTDISITDMRKFRDRLLDAGVSPRTVNIRLGTLRSILRRNGLWERIRPDFKMLPVRDDFGRILNQPEEYKLLEACRASISRALYYVVALALCTAMRAGEIRYLQWSQVDLERGIISISRSKTRAGRRRVPLNESARGLMSVWAESFPGRQPHHFVFPSERYGGVGGPKGPCTYDTDPTKPMGSWKTAFNVAKRRSGVKVRFHDLRHTAVTRMVEAGIPIAIISKCVGWSVSTEVLMLGRYFHLSDTRAKAAFDALELSHKARPDTRQEKPTSETGSADSMRKEVQSERSPKPEDGAVDPGKRSA